MLVPLAGLENRIVCGDIRGTKFVQERAGCCGKAGARRDNEV